MSSRFLTNLEYEISPSNTATEPMFIGASSLSKYKKAVSWELSRCLSLACAILRPHPFSEKTPNLNLSNQCSPARYSGIIIRTHAFVTVVAKNLLL